MKLAFSTNAYKQTTLEAAIDSIASIGYTGVELMADLHHAYAVLNDVPAKVTGTLRADADADAQSGLVLIKGRCQTCCIPLKSTSAMAGF